jgi:hypothetical protein
VNHLWKGEFKVKIITKVKENFILFWVVIAAGVLIFLLSIEEKIRGEKK